jgi:5-methyltetrahydrofolate--homocysteine methyltransferase
LTAGAVLVADGATGTMLQADGLPTGTPGEAWILERPDRIRALHLAYLDAGSDLILTTTFGATRARLDASGLSAEVSTLNHTAAEIARTAAGDDRYVGGDLGPTGEMMPPIGKLTYESALEMFAEQAAALALGGVDVIFIETMSDLQEARAAVEGARQACDLPIFCCFSFDHHGRTGMGVAPRVAAQSVRELGASAVGANCGHAPEELLEILPVMKAATPGAFLIAKPNAGTPRMVKRQVVYDATPDQMARLAVQFVELGASIVGGCCGSSPEHIRAIRESVAGSGASTS